MSIKKARKTLQNKEKFNFGILDEVANSGGLLFRNYHFYPLQLFLFSFVLFLPAAFVPYVLSYFTFFRMFDSFVVSSLLYNLIIPQASTKCKQNRTFVCYIFPSSPFCQIDPRLFSLNFNPVHIIIIPEAKN